jgi:hypothetical protein
MQIRLGTSLFMLACLGTPGRSTPWRPGICVNTPVEHVHRDEAIEPIRTAGDGRGISVQRLTGPHSRSKVILHLP